MDRAKPDHVVLNMDQESLNKFQSMEAAGVKDQITREEKSHHTATRAKSLRRLSFSKPKSRFLEYNYAAVTQNSTIPESNNIESSPEKRDSLSSSSSEEDEDEWSDDEAWLEEDDDGGAEKRRSRGKFRKNKRKFNWRLFAEWQGKWKEARNAFKSKKFGSRKIDMEKLRKLSMERTASAWKMKRLVNYIMSSGLATISRTVDDFSKAESEITSEWEARNAARRIFKNVAKPGAKYIEEEDLMRFLKRVEVHTIFPLFEGAMETGRISKLAFRNWVVRAYFERKSLAHSLNDTKTAVQQLHKLASAIVTVFIIVVTILVMELTTVQVMLFVISQIIIMGVIFQNMCKTVFESIVFVFVMHPFDIGDRCVVDGVQMIVEEMNILTTVFLRYDMEKIYYPNAVLLTKPISNFYRSPEMGDGIEFAIDITTPVDTITALKKAIQGYIESKPNYWNPKHSVVMKEIVNVQSMKMALYVQHTINHQNYGERTSRISELVMELKKIFENLGITYRLLPQEIHLTQLNMDASWRIPTSHP
ncbi:hypothetical protein Tsubulata_006619 [Turnera subulata]|uniref:Mechanosensitive ion channel MscS domain-containing protein n=1 Tax=Turnera subulata TaxID=218843 RepID=A0A9Q0J5S9_9ROSI|nr:hypothetical protein Tsubulata_006619 [Turnera subulata]